MTQRRWLLVIYTTFALAFIGLLVFVGGVVVEFVTSRRIGAVSEGISPYTALALGGLCFTALMLALCFILSLIHISEPTRH